jgi:DNA polymerase
MTSAEKLRIADFLDLSNDFLATGYYSARKEYQFDDDKELPIVETPQAVQDDGSDSLEKIATEVRACGNCGLCRNRKNAAPGEGVPQPLVMVIGEGPGADEDALGRPFVGKAGQYLDRMLNAVNLSRNSNCFIANVVKCRPPNNRDPYPDETAACAHFLERQIILLKPKIILVVGSVAIKNLLKTSEGISKMRGKFLELTVKNNTFPLIATYHPAAVLRDPGLRRPVWDDLQILRKKLDEGLR